MAGQDNSFWYLKNVSVSKTPSLLPTNESDVPHVSHYPVSDYVLCGKGLMGYMESVYMLFPLYFRQGDVLSRSYCAHSDDYI